MLGPRLRGNMSKVSTAKLNELAERVDRLISPGETFREDAKAGLFLLRETQPSAFQATIYEPIVCLILQGEKETTIADRTLTVSRGQCIVVSHDLPVIARVTKASRAKPYLSLVVDMDVSVLRSLYDEVGGESVRDDSPCSMQVAPVDEPTLGVLERYLDVLNDPVEARVLLPLVRKELHFRLYQSQSGAMLRSLLRRDSHASNIALAIKSLREGYRDYLDVPALAKSVGMSVSSFHKHFKSVTLTTPLQYQKDLRLTEARRLLHAGRSTVSTAAFDVGYESPSQFSREYSRKFGVPPSADLGVA